MNQWTKTAIDEIKAMRIPHRNYERCLSEALATLVAAEPGEVVSIIGPSRVGKSRLAAELSRLIAGSKNEGDLMPVVSVLASNCTNRGVFRTKDFAVHCLEAIRHPIYGVSRPDDPWNVARMRLIENTSESTLSDAFIAGLKYRKSLYLVTDESQHVRYALGGDLEAAAILDSWKSLAAQASVVLVTVGAYPLIHVLRLCPHLLGRKHQVHFPRYSASEEDLVVFDQILGVYSSVIRLPPSVQTLRDWNNILYPDSLGCIGLLNRGLRQGLAKAHSENADHLTKDHLLFSRRPVGDLKEIAAEIADGEKALLPDNNETNQTVIISDSTSPPKPKRRPFTKLPRRYKAGGRS